MYTEWQLPPPAPSFHFHESYVQLARLIRETISQTELRLWFCFAKSQELFSASDCSTLKSGYQHFLHLCAVSWGPQAWKCAGKVLEEERVYFLTPRHFYGVDKRVPCIMAGTFLGVCVKIAVGKTSLFWKQFFSGIFMTINTFSPPFFFIPVHEFL